jgi:hypothetical protein
VTQLPHKRNKNIRLTFEQFIQAAIIFSWMNFVEPLVFAIFNPWAKGFPQHRKGGKVHCRIRTGIKVPLIRVKVADIVEVDPGLNPAASALRPERAAAGGVLHVRHGRPLPSSPASIIAQRVGPILPSSHP